MTLKSLLDVLYNYSNHMPMNITALDTIYNIFLLLLWNKIWTVDNSAILYNPVLAPAARLQNRIFEFIKPLFPFSSLRITAALSLVLLIIFRGFAIPQSVQWNLSFGFTGSSIQKAGIIISVLFSMLSFAVFIFQIWTLSTIYNKTVSLSARDSASDALFQISKPFSLLDTAVKPPVLLIAGMLISFALININTLYLPVPPTAFLTRILQLFIASLSGIVSILIIIQQLVFIMIIGSLAAMIMGSINLSVFCNGIINTLIGPLRNYPIRIGAFDLTPIVFMFAVNLIHIFLQNILYNALQSLS